MQEESPCSTKIRLYTNFFVTFSILFLFLFLFFVSLQQDFSVCDTSEGSPNLLSSALPDIPSDRGSALGGTRLSDRLCRPEGIAFKRRAVDASLRH